MRSFVLFLTILFTAGIFFIPKAATAQAPTPNFNTLAPCPTCINETIAVLSGTQPSGAEIEPSVVTVSSSPTNNPCDNEVASDNAHHSRHHKHHGAISNGMSDILKQLIELLNKIIALLGGSPISLPETSPGEQPGVSGAPISVPGISGEPVSIPAVSDQPQQENPCPQTTSPGTAE